MGKRTLSQTFVASAIFAVACGGRVGLMSPSDSGTGSGGSSSTATGGTISRGTGGTSSTGTGGTISRGTGGTGGTGGTVFLGLPDGGLPALLGDSGILNGILDAPRDSLLGQLICGPEAKSGVPCSTSTPGCVLPNAGGACACLGGVYICPSNPTQGPVACPQGAANGNPCTALLTVCIGGGANACICTGSYICL